MHSSRNFDVCLISVAWVAQFGLIMESAQIHVIFSESRWFTGNKILHACDSQICYSKNLLEKLCCQFTVCINMYSSCHATWVAINTASIVLQKLSNVPIFQVGKCLFLSNFRCNICSKRSSVRINSWFGHHPRIKLRGLFQMISSWSCGPSGVDVLAAQTGTNRRSCSKIFNSFNEAIITRLSYTVDSVKIGGLGKYVVMDESFALRPKVFNEAIGLNSEL